MAITTRYATNTALQYNEVDMTDYLIDLSNGSRRFLTEQPRTRLLRAAETSALYFVSNGSLSSTSARYRWYDSGGTLLNEFYLALNGAGVHNSIPADWSSLYVPNGAVKMTVAIVGNANLIANGQFTQGTGNTFTSWTLTQPSRTNIVQRSQEFDNAYWTKTDVTIIADSVTAPDGTMTADTLNEVAINNFHGLFRANILSTNTFAFSVYAKKKDRDYLFMILNNGASDFLTIFNISDGTVASNAGGNTTFIEALPNGWYRCSISRPITDVGSDNIYFGVSNSPTNPLYVGDVTKGIYLWGAQLETNLLTPYIPTTTTSVTTSLGEFLQDTTGGPDGSRCVRMWADDGGGTLIDQNINIVAGQTYRLRFRAKADALYGTDTIEVDDGSFFVYGTFAITSEWAWYTATFVAPFTASQPMYFSYLNDDTYGFVSLDDISVVNENQSLLTYEQTYILDDSCAEYEYQLNWLNKLGGRDTWVFTGFPVTSREVDRTAPLEYSRRTNLTAPNRIYGFRQIASRETLTLTHQCKNRETAEWLKSELIDSIDVLVKVGDDYYPCDVVGSSIVTNNTFSQDYSVRVTLRFAFDINVQNR